MGGIGGVEVPKKRTLNGVKKSGENRERRTPLLRDGEEGISEKKAILGQLGGSIGSWGKTIKKVGE